MAVKTSAISIGIGPLLLILLGLGATFGTGIVLDRTDDDAREIVLVGKPYASTTALWRWYEQLASRDEGKTKILIMSAFFNRDDASEVLAGKGRTELSYDEVLRRRDLAHARGPLRMIRLLAIKNNVMMQSTDGASISRRVLSGTDPSMLQVGRIACEILELHFNRLPRSIRSNGSNPLRFTIFLKTNVLPTYVEAEELTRSLQLKLDHADLLINIRTDTWFVEDSGFPLRYPFSGDENVPTREAHRRAGEVFCLGNNETVRCKPSAELK